jgi:hypothetical protein
MATGIEERLSVVVVDRVFAVPLMGQGIDALIQESIVAFDVLASVDNDNGVVAFGLCAHFSCGRLAASQSENGKNNHHCKE